MAEENQLIVFTRYPVPGHAKTRLIPKLGPAGACQLQREMSGHTLLTCRYVAGALPADVDVRFAGGSTRKMRQWMGNGTSYTPQGGGDLGDRMKRACHDHFEAGAKRVVIVGTDCPSMTPAILEDAFNSLADHDVVLGPAVDGGYYLIGLRALVPEIFTGISWGTDTVLRETLAAIEGREFSIRWLPPLPDVDRPEDLPAWHARRPRPVDAALKPHLSVIIPALNESRTLAQCLESVGDEASEILVVDGGSTDDTVAIATTLGARIIASEPGRAGQMNAGAVNAGGDILLFLHADTILPAGYAEPLVETITTEGVAAGAFRLRIDGERLGLRFIEWAVRLRCRVGELPFGDQGFFVASSLFHEMGGFADLPIMEDYDLVRRLRRRGRVTMLSSAVRTSGRRWRHHGLWRTTWINQRVILGYRLGEAPAVLARRYRTEQTERRSPA